MSLFTKLDENIEKKEKEIQEIETQQNQQLKILSAILLEKKLLEEDYLKRLENICEKLEKSDMFPITDSELAKTERIHKMLYSIEKTLGISYSSKNKTQNKTKTTK
jgi:hypothetical protein